ncbi:MAG: hypothetical protein SGI77_01460 [Pirellulaceae bacterium]|nr:hypothetical protein [Pirellulaceae bacterium]
MTKQVCIRFVVSAGLWIAPVMNVILGGENLVVDLEMTSESVPVRDPILERSRAKIDLLKRRLTEKDHYSLP